MVFVKSAHVVTHVVFPAPRLRNKHHHRVRRVTSGGNKQFEDVVERGRVGLSAVDDRQNLLQFRAEDRRRKRRFTRGERIQIALDRVYLAVVRDGAKRMCQLP